MDNKTVVISCAGMGTRFGIGVTKALVDIAGKPLIIRQLEMLNKVKDVRIVVGFQAEKVIDLVKNYRSDIMFAFNNDYKTTGTGASLSKGMINANEYIVALDGDLLVHPNDMAMVLDSQYECIGGGTPTTDNPVLMTLDKDDRVIEFSRDRGELEWTGLAQIKSSRLKSGDGHVYQMIEPLLPIKAVRIRTREVDTVNDYERAVSWVKSNFED